MQQASRHSKIPRTMRGRQGGRPCQVPDGQDERLLQWHAFHPGFSESGRDGFHAEQLEDVLQRQLRDVVWLSVGMLQVSDLRIALSPRVGDDTMRDVQVQLQVTVNGERVDLACPGHLKTLGTHVQHVLAWCWAWGDELAPADAAWRALCWPESEKFHGAGKPRCTALRRSPNACADSCMNIQYLGATASCSPQPIPWPAPRAARPAHGPAPGFVAGLADGPRAWAIVRCGGQRL